MPPSKSKVLPPDPMLPERRRGTNIQVLVLVVIVIVVVIVIITVITMMAEVCGVVSGLILPASKIISSL